MEQNIFKEMINKLSAKDIAMLSPLHLAYIGDAVYELLVRTFVLSKKIPVKELHKLSTDYVKAKAQSDIVHKLEEYLTEEEKAIVIRGRNAKSNSIAKNATVIDYKYATGFEALIGYLYLTENMDRIGEIFRLIIEDNLN